METSRSRPTKSIPHVALIIETSTAYGRALIRGATRYIREAGPWTVYIEQRSLQDSAPPWLKNWGGDGIISRASTPRSARAILCTGIPTVDLNDQVKGLGLPQIHSDHEAIARLAAEHLLDRGFHHFAYFEAGSVDRSYRVVRCDGTRQSPRVSAPPAASSTRTNAHRWSPGATSNPRGKGRLTARPDGSRSCPSPWA